MLKGAVGLGKAGQQLWYGANLLMLGAERVMYHIWRY
jgi:hypothetical protein